MWDVHSIKQNTITPNIHNRKKYNHWYSLNISVVWRNQILFISLSKWLHKWRFYCLIFNIFELMLSIWEEDFTELFDKYKMYLQIGQDFWQYYFLVNHNTSGVERPKFFVNIIEQGWILNAVTVIAKRRELFMFLYNPSQKRWYYSFTVRLHNAWSREWITSPSLMFN